MIIENIILIQRDGKQEWFLNEIEENGLCHLVGIGHPAKLTLRLFHILNALNTPNGAWSLKIPEEKKYIYDTEVWVKGKLLSECENNCDIIEVESINTPFENELVISRFRQIRKRIFQ